MNECNATRRLEYDSQISHKSQGMRIFKGAIMLTPGTWADMVTNANVLYKSDVIDKYSNNWVSNYIDLQHSHHPRDLVGTVHNQYSKNGILKGDLWINTNLTAGRDIVQLIDSNIVNQLSIEMFTNDKWDSNTHVRSVELIKFLGVAIIGGPDIPACKDTRIN